MQGIDQILIGLKISVSLEFNYEHRQIFVYFGAGGGFYPLKRLSLISRSTIEKQAKPFASHLYATR